MDHPAVKAAASWLVDGVLDIESIARGVGLEAALKRGGLDWITKGAWYVTVCNGGLDWITKGTWYVTVCNGM